MQSRIYVSENALRINKLAIFLKNIQNIPPVLLSHKASHYKFFSNRKRLFMMKQTDEKNIAESIRKDYVAKEHTQLDTLQALDKKVKKPVKIFSYVFGTLSAMIMGSGMSLVMTNIGSIVGIADPMFTGIIIGVIGLVLAILNYPLHNHLLKSRKKKYANEIIALTDKLIQDSMQKN